MSVPSAVRSPRPFRLPAWTPAAAGLAAVAGIGALLQPDFGLLARESMAVKIHWATAVTAFALGLILITGRKGRTFHRVGGWIWVIVMITTAVASLFITGINGDAWSWIHILSGMTLVMAPLGLYRARKHDVKRHRDIMVGLYAGGMLIAGGFTFLPDRLMWQMFFG